MMFSAEFRSDQYWDQFCFSYSYILSLFNQSIPFDFIFLVSRFPIQAFSCQPFLNKTHLNKCEYCVHGCDEINELKYIFKHYHVSLIDSGRSIYDFDFRATLARTRVSIIEQKYIRLLNHKWQTAHVYNQSTSYTKYGPPAQHAG